MQISNPEDYWQQSYASLQFPQIRDNYIKSFKKKKRKTPIIANLADTQYQVVEDVCDELSWQINYENCKNWDIKWTDGSVGVEVLSKMLQHQKINHFPGMNTLSRKNNLAINIERMEQQFPDHYDFIPRTFILPEDANILKQYFQINKGVSKTFIVKPQASSQGRGIFLTQSLQQIELYSHCIVQKYVSSPLLYKGLKFDLRVYALVAGCDPLRIYIYNEGLVRFATEKYQSPDEDNIDDLYMHLTNYAINKQNPKYVFNKSIENLSHGHKKSLAQFFQTLKGMGYKAHQYWADIKDIIVKTVISGQPHISHEYKMAQPNNFSNNMCFEVLGFDFMIGSNNKVDLLEINYTPSFSIQTPLDELIKSNLIRDTLNIMNINSQSRDEVLTRKKQEQERRVYTGKMLKVTPIERERLVKEQKRKRDQYQKQNQGSFDRIYPNRNAIKQEKYQKILQFASRKYKELSTKPRFSQNRKLTSKYRIKKLLTNQTTCEQQKKQVQHFNDNQFKVQTQKDIKFYNKSQTKYTPTMKNASDMISNRNLNKIVQNKSQLLEQLKIKNSKKDLVIYELSNSPMKEKTQLNTKNEEETVFSKQIRLLKMNN